MPLLINSSMLTDYLGEGCITDEQATAFITAAQTAIEMYCTGRVGAFTSGATQTYGFRPRITTKVLPVKYGAISSITSVTLDGSTVTNRFENNGLYGIRVKPSANFDLLEQYGVRSGQYLEVTFIQGWTDVDLVPAAIKQAVLLLAVDKFRVENPNLVMEKIGNTEEKYSDRNLAEGSEMPSGVKVFLKGLIDPFMYAIV